MRVPLKIEGDSLVIRVPLDLLENCRHDDEVDIDVLKGALLVKPVNSSCRQDWKKHLKSMKETGVDNLLIEEPSLVKMDDWEW